MIEHEHNTKIVKLQSYFLIKKISKNIFVYKCINRHIINSKFPYFLIFLSVDLLLIKTKNSNFKTKTLKNK